MENAIEIAYKVTESKPEKDVYLLSEMIHNPSVNDDLKNKGVKFLMNTKGEALIDLDSLEPDSIVIIPAFGTTLETIAKLKSLGIEPYRHDATCPFVRKVWKRAGRALGARIQCGCSLKTNTRGNSRNFFS